MSTIVWVGLGLVLLIAEMLSLSFVLLFFGVSAILVALVKLLGVNNLPLELFIFALGGLGGLFLFRKKLVLVLQAKKGLSIDYGAVITLTNDVKAGGRTDVQYQGTTWTAVNESSTDLQKGQEAVIARTEGVRLYIKPPETRQTAQ